MRVKAEELKLGNNIYLTGENVIEVTLPILSELSTSTSIQEGYYYPIILTEDILINNFKFRKLQTRNRENFRYEHEDLFYEVEKQGNKFCFVVTDLELPTTIHYICHTDKVHEFQNSFEALEQGKKLKFYFKNIINGN